MFAINTRAPFFLIQDALRLMHRDKIPGTVVNVLSMSGHGGQPFIAAYCSSKGALATLTNNAAFAMLPDRIRINGLNIGWMDTPGEQSIQRRYHNARKDWLKRAEKGRPFGRFLKPPEVAKAIAFLASDESGMMTGSIIDSIRPSSARMSELRRGNRLNASRIPRIGQRLPSAKIIVATLLLGVCGFRFAVAHDPFADFDGYARDALDGLEHTTLAIAVVKDGRVVFARGYGVAKSVAATQSRLTPSFPSPR